MEKINNSPSCEIVTIGSELLLGQIIDTNTSYLAQELNRIGVTIRYRTAVGDQLEEIEEILSNAVKRCDMVITTGGLGPTLDDLTRQAVAKVAGVELEFVQELMEEIEEIFSRAGYQMPENNRRQAFVPRASMAISNPVGTAPAFMKDVNGSPVICLPGVPKELKHLLSTAVLPWLQERFDLTDQLITYRVLKTAGLGESKVDTFIGESMGSGKNPEVGLLASAGEIKIRIAAKARDPREAETLIHGIEEEIRSRLGDKIFGADEETLEGVIFEHLRGQDLSLCLLETFTGGMAANRLYQIPSKRLKESLVVQGRDQLSEFFQGDQIDLGKEGQSLHMADKLREICNADVGLVILGFPREESYGYSLKGFTAAVGEGIQKTFSWDMGGDTSTLQTRGTVIGLNTLRLALLGSHLDL